MDSSPLISVIVPVYNVEDYLEKCVKSILSQTYPKFELILVDDGSKDSSGSICDKLASFDSRIVCIHKQNGGLSSARNTALDLCKGQYITFVDSDDLIASNALELMMDYAIKCQSDIVVTSYIISFSDDNVVPSPAAISGCLSFDHIDTLQEILCKSTRWEAWGHLFKKSLWDDVRFPEGILYEDLATTPYIFAKSDQITILQTALYYYYKRPGSIMRQSEKKISMDLCHISEKLIEHFKYCIPDKSKRANICSGILMELCSRTDLAAQNIKINKEFVNKARKILRKNIHFVLSSDYYNVKQKVYYFLESHYLHWLIYKIHNR